MGWFTKDVDEDKKETETESEEEEEEEEEDDNSYQVEIGCDNCGDVISYDIQFGITVKDYIRGKKCDACGCLIQDETK